MEASRGQAGIAIGLGGLGLTGIGHRMVRLGEHRWVDELVEHQDPRVLQPGEFFKTGPYGGVNVFTTRNPTTLAKIHTGGAVAVLAGVGMLVGGAALFTSQ